MAQPNNEDQEGRVHPDDAMRLVAAAVISALVGAAAVHDATDPRQLIPTPILVMLATLVIVAWLLYAVKREGRQLARRLDRIEARIEERLTSAEAAEGFVDGLMLRPNEGRALRSV